MQSRLNYIGKSNISVIDASYETDLFEEDISVEHSGDSWKNYYWVDPETSLVVKSKQRIGPNFPVIEMTILKPYAS
ncbi:putative lipoprotein GfcB precursor [compost metagenome]